eukprot:g296.t1
MVVHVSSFAKYLENAMPSYPPLWNRSDASVRMLGGGTDKQGRLRVDPFNYTHRLTMYKELINVEHCLWRSDNESNPVWGLPLQHGWQMYSGRLCVEPPEVALSPTCWWACANYYFSIYPYLGAVGAGLVPPIALSIPVSTTAGGTITTTRSQWCASYADCANVSSVKLWKAFFQSIRETKENCTSSSTAANGDPLMDKLMEAYWSSHTSTILSTEQCADQLPALTDPEREFAADWSNIVQFIGPSLFDVNYTQTTVMQDEILPLRVLRENDTIGSVKDFSKTVNEGMELLKLVRDANDVSKGELLRVYERAMCTPDARAAMRRVMTEFASSRIKTAEDAMRILIDLVARSPFCK